MNPGDVALLGNAVLLDTVQRTIEPRIMAMIQEFGDAEMHNLGFRKNVDIQDARVIAFLAEHSAKTSVGINETTRMQMMKELADGLAEGDDAINARLRRFFTQAAIVRARMIARTTTNTTGNFAVWLAHVQSGSVLQRRWVAVRDNVTRDHHLQLHGQRRAIDRPFQIPSTGARAMYPGGFGIPREDINCRCTTVPTRYITQDDAGDDALRQYDIRVSEWETLLSNALAAMFMSQMRDVLRIMREMKRR